MSGPRKKMDRSHVTTTLPNDLIELLDRYVRAERGLTKALVMEIALRRFLTKEMKA